jgi:hypothetical protein
VQKIKELRKALAVGEKSGFIKKIDPKIHLEMIHRKFTGKKIDESDPSTQIEIFKITSL